MANSNGRNAGGRAPPDRGRAERARPGGRRSPHGTRRGDRRRRQDAGEPSRWSRPARSAPASSWRAVSARRCGSWPARAATARRGHSGHDAEAGPDRPCPDEPVAVLRTRVARRLQALVPVLSRRRLHGPLPAGRVQLTARLLPRGRVPRRPARPRRRVRDAEGLPGPGRSGRRDRHDRDAAAGDDDGDVRLRLRRRRVRCDVGGERRDERDHQGRQPRLRPGRDPASLEDAGHRRSSWSSPPASSPPACCS